MHIIKLSKPPKWYAQINYLLYIYIYIYTHTPKIESLYIQILYQKNLVPKVWIDYSGYLNGIDNLEMFLWLDYIIILKTPADTWWKVKLLYTNHKLIYIF